MATQAGSQLDRFDALANSPMVENRPTVETTQVLKDELLFQRATQTYLWALPLINSLGMKVGSERAFGAGYNVLPVLKKRLDAKTLVTTPNSDVIYAMNYVDVARDGPLAFEAPPGLQGILLDFWQNPIPGPRIGGTTYFGDVGFPGPDGGKGGDWRGMLASLGIIKGQPFKPDARTRATLDRAAKTAYKMSRVIGFEELVTGRNYRVYPDRHWVNPIADGTPANPSGAMDWVGTERTVGTSTLMPASGFSRITTRSAPA
jgi:hypothetical protein